MESVRTDEEQVGLGRRERKKQEIEDRIRRAALELFREQGYSATTVEQIADRADVAKGTVFNYFPRKESLLMVLADELVASVHEVLGPREALIAGGVKALRRVLLYLAERAVRDPELSRTIVIEGMRAYWEDVRQHAVQEEFHELLLAMLREAQARGEIRSDVDPFSALALLRAAYFATLVEWLRECTGPRPVLEELAMRFDIIFRGLANTEAGGRSGA
ncbi:MAG TPA: TetR/AcrR family transcriptional regulator [Longimicrobiales bacterium]|nr:TetR/AcrR family transcriptional regulator [Longimicrobiales bacterium]